MKQRKGYRLPIKAKLYQWTGKKMRPLGQYRTNKGYSDKLRLYAEVMPEAEIYVFLTDYGWHRAVFNNLKDDKGMPVEFGWELVESKGVGTN